jgi:hypothetical protein
MTDNTTSAVAKPRTFQGDLAHLPAALLPLTKLRRWVIWKWQRKDEISSDPVRSNRSNSTADFTKVPYRPHYYNQTAKNNDPSTWGNYEEAILAHTQKHCDGIGFMLLDSEYGAIDLDHIRDFSTGQVLRWAEKLLAEAANAGCYLEWTVSGTGARIVGIAKGSELHRKITVHRKSRVAVEFYKHCARYITISGVQINGEYPELPVSEALPDCDAFFDALFARFCDDTQRPKESECEFAGGVHITIEEIEETPSIFDFNDVGPQEPIDYDDLVERGAPQGERSEEFQRTVWHLASQGKSVEEIAAELARHPTGIGLKYAGRLLAEVQRSYRKWKQQRLANALGGGAGSSAPFAPVPMPAPPPAAAPTFMSPWPQIRVVAGELPRVVAEAENALLAYAWSNIYQRGGRLVLPTEMKYAASDDREDRGWRLIEVTKPEMIHVLSCAAQFWKYDGRMKAWKVIDPPEIVADMYLARRGRWKLPVLTGIVQTPFLRRDGSICEMPGYDAASGLLFLPEGERFPPIPQQPAKADAELALAKLVDLISTFPFVGEADRSVALSAMLTTLDRRSMPTAPLHGYTAPTVGTGKSLLVDICSILASGRLMPVISPGRNEEELEKRLGSALLAGDTAISLDNCEHVLEGTLLCQVLTQRQVNIRILGKSRNDTTPTNVTMFATGNNLVLAGDLTRRALQCAMDARCERPELREFSVKVDEFARQRRSELVVAALTVLRAYHVSNERVSLLPFGSFEQWSHRIRAPLVWLGKADPCDTMIEIRENDPYRAQLVAVITQWEQHLRINNRYTIQEVITSAINEPSFYAALMAVANARTGHTISPDRLGRWLKRMEGKMVGNLALRSPGKVNGSSTWWLVKV